MINEFAQSQDLTLLLVLAQIEYKLGNAESCNHLCDQIIRLNPSNLHALEMKGDICKHFCQIDQAFYYYSKAIERNPGSYHPSISSALSNMGDLYKLQGKMKEAILHYEGALMKEVEKQGQGNMVWNFVEGQRINLDKLNVHHTNQISKIYSETFMKLFQTKMACCDWKDDVQFVQHLKQILIKQFQNGELPCIDPFSLFMIDFTLDEKLLISAKWAENEKAKAFEQMKRK